MYNTTNLTNAMNLQEHTVAINQLSSGAFGIGLLILLYIGMFIVFKKYEKDTKATMLFTATLGMVLSILMWAAQLLYTKFLAFPMILLFTTLIIFKFSD